VGRPVTHRKGRGWRGGFLGSAVEQYIKLDLNKWLKVLRHLELLPRPLGQDWSEIWLQHFSGTITIWPKSIPSDFWNILSDPSPQRLARMLQAGQHSAFPKIQFVKNRAKVENLIMRGLRSNSITGGRELSPLLSRRLYVADQEAPDNHPSDQPAGPLDKSLLAKHQLADQDSAEDAAPEYIEAPDGFTTKTTRPTSRRNSVIEEVKRQSAVFFDDPDLYGEDGTISSDEDPTIQ
jgi:hypothetical protein